MGFYHEDKSAKDLPHNANGIITQEVFETLQALSAEYGTKLKRQGVTLRLLRKDPFPQ